LIAIERISPQIALVYKDVRLRALLDSPTAFSGTYAKESQFPDDEWMKRSVRWSSDGFAAYLAFDGERACGMVFTFAEEQDPHRAQILSMWVDPEVRRAGVGRMLIDAALAWAESRHVRDVKLMVTSVNDAAIAFYERLGFRRTGKTAVYPNDASITEYEMVRAIVP
jgi:ribosomal protein S18 acetylase RimI-like enzyme